MLEGLMIVGGDRETNPGEEGAGAARRKQEKRGQEAGFPWWQKTGEIEKIGASCFNQSLNVVLNNQSKYKLL